jgi:cytochrome c oxidase cbb3-type subunit 3
MSDFTSPFWSYFITFIVLGGIIGCLALLFMTSKVQEMSKDNTTGHVYDEDIVEMNNPLPKWWMYLFVATSVFGFVYLALYPALGTNEGAYGWSSKKQYEEEVEASKQQIAPIYAKFAEMSTEEVAKDEKAMAIGERLFMNNCSMCHGSDAHGSRGFPNLTDKDWLHGGKPKNIIQTITNGRNGMMPPMAAAVGSPDDVKNVANYVLSLSGAPHDMNRASLGKPKFAACAACHGVEGKGNQMIGAPNLSDNIWLHGYGEEAIIERINHGKQNQMPAQKTRLTPEQIHVVAAYVWRFSNMPEAAQMTAQ